jgi:hypothetical protein
MEKTLTLGSVDLSKYVNWAEQVINNYYEKVNENKSQIDSLIEKLRKDNLESESLPLHKLEQQRIALEYPTLNTSFLSMHNIINAEGQEIQAPKFSVYPVYSGNKFSIMFYLGSGIHKVNAEIFNDYRYHYPDSHLADVGKEPLLKEPLLKSLEIGKLQREDFRRYKKVGRGHSFKIESKFNGIIPDLTKQKIKESEKFFDKDKVYLIAETKPEEWNVILLSKDPLVAGVKYDKCYLIDQFNTTPLEGLVSEEFSSL